MKKKKIALGLGVVLLVILNVLIFSHKGVISGSIEFNVQIQSDQEQDIQVFYEQGGTISEQNSQVYKCASDRKQQFTYKIPVGTERIRLDLGILPGHFTLGQCYFNYRDTVVNMDISAGENLGNTNDILSITGMEEGIKIVTEGEDPHIWIYVPNDTLLPAMEHHAHVKAVILNILMALFLDGMALILLWKKDKFLHLPIELYQNRSLIWGLSVNDFKTKYAGSYLGIIWGFIQPMVTILVYWFVFSVGFKSGLASNYPFVLYLVTGIIPWLFFQDALNGGTNALMEYSYLVKKVVFKISVLPIVKIISAFFVHMFFVLVALILCAAYGYLPTLYTLQIFYYAACTFIFTLALVYGTSAIVIFFRDLSQLINVFLQVGIWMTPIMWDIQMINDHPMLQQLFKFNPMYYIVTGYRDSMLGQTGFWEHWGWTLYFWVVTAALFGLGTVIFKKLKPHFADVL